MRECAYLFIQIIFKCCEHRSQVFIGDDFFQGIFNILISEAVD